MHDPDNRPHDRPHDEPHDGPGERLLEGVVHDGHAEVQPDPELAGGDSAEGDPNRDVIAKHRRDARAVEAHNVQAADETRGALARDRPD